jgi:hypothetical protein
MRAAPSCSDAIYSGALIAYARLTLSLHLDATCLCGAQGTTLMAAGCRIAAEDCHITSNGMRLGLVVQGRAVTDEMRHEGAPVDDLIPGLASVHGCTFADHMWGASLGTDASADEQRSLLNANTFTSCAGGNLCHEFDDTGQGAQPWRRRWAGEL